MKGNPRPPEGSRGNHESRQSVSYCKGKIGVHESGHSRMSSKTGGNGFFRDAVFEHFQDHIERFVTSAHCIHFLSYGQKNGGPGEGAADAEIDG
jgi:hypothetical protein